MSSRKGRALEIVIEAIEASLTNHPDSTVESPKMMLDKTTGETREHDVVLTIRDGHHEMPVAIECRNRARKVTVNEVESFMEKCRETGIAAGAIVSSSGFYKTALSKAGRLGIRCLHLDEVEDFDWLKATGITVVYRRLKHTDVSVNTVDKLDEEIEDFYIRHNDGTQITLEVLKTNIVQALNKVDIATLPPGPGKMQIKFSGDNVVLIHKETETRHAITNIIAIAEYEIVHEFRSFTHHQYVDEDGRRRIVDAVVADVSVETIEGTIVLVYDEEKGGKVTWTSKKIQ